MESGSVRRRSKSWKAALPLLEGISGRSVVGLPQRSQVLRPTLTATYETCVRVSKTESAAWSMHCNGVLLIGYHSLRVDMVIRKVEIEAEVDGDVKGKDVR